MASMKGFFLVTLTLLSLISVIFCFEIYKEAPYDVRPSKGGFEIHLDVHRQKREVTDQPPSEATDANGNNDETHTTEGGITAGPTSVTTAPTTTTITTTLAPTTTTNWTTFEDHHEYYSSQVFSGMASSHSKVWKDKKDYPSTVRHDSLSHAHRTAYTYDLSFKFPFYGHWVQKITIATGGFLYMSEFVHEWLTATQYIAPLMANFDTRIGNDSDIYFVDTGSEFVVWWEHLHLNDDVEAGYFTFQVHLAKSGVITFAYKEVPKNLPALSTKNHRVTVGLSDAFYIDERISENLNKRMIYEYHQVEILPERIANDGAVFINPKPTCVIQEDCKSCVTADIKFECHWCTALDLARCSDGLDRHRQEWLQSGCHKQEKLKEEDCPVESPSSGPDSGTLAAVIVVVILIVIIIAVVTGWFVYAYRNPNSDSGRWLIEHRPSQIRESLSKVKFWKKENTADKYGVSVGADSTA